jgi:catalase
MKIKEMLKENNAMAELVSKVQGNVKGADGSLLEVNKSFITTASVLYDAVFIPGGGQCVDRLKVQGDAVHFINEMFRHCKPVAASGEAVELLVNLGLTGVKLAEDPNASVIEEMGVVCGRDAARMDELAGSFKLAILKHRHWEREKADEMVPA